MPILYALIGIVASGVLPGPLYVCLIVGGAMLVETSSEPGLQACDERFRTPHVLLSILSAVGLFAILTGIDLVQIVEYSVILGVPYRALGAASSGQSELLSDKSGYAMKQK